MMNEENDYVQQSAKESHCDMAFKSKQMTDDTNNKWIE